MAGSRFLHPLGVGETLDAAVRIMRERYLALLTACVVVVIPLEVVHALIVLSIPTPQRYVDSAGFTVRTTNSWAPFAAILLIVVISLIIGTLVQGACLKMLTDAYLDTDTTWQQSLQFAFKRFWSLLWISLITAVTVVLGSCLCYVPGIWLGVSFALAVPAMLLESERGFKAIGRSFNLVKGRWWGTFGTLITAYLLITVIVYGLSLFIQLVLLHGNGSFTTTQITSALSQAIAYILALPFLAAVLTVVYFDRRVRKEGFDIALLTQTIGLAPAPAPRADAPVTVTSAPSWQPGPTTPTSAPWTALDALPPPAGPPPAPTEQAPREPAAPEPPAPEPPATDAADGPPR
jgi:Membrane domain of glycerophosphoryl diester phosphodiesterase